MAAESDGAAMDTQRAFMQALRRLDPEERGSVRREDLVTVMRALFPNWSDTEINVMVGASGTESASGRVDLERFAAWLFAGAQVSEAESVGPITPEDFVLALANMTRAWEVVPEAERLPEDEELGFFEDDCLSRCGEMIARWHSGKSSHPARERLAARYPSSEAGAEALHRDLLAMRADPAVEAADRELRLTKFTAPARGAAPGPGDVKQQCQSSTGAVDHIDRAFETLLRDLDDPEPPGRFAEGGQ